MLHLMPKNKTNLNKTGLNQDRAVLIVCIGIAFIFWLLVKLSQEYSDECTVLLNYELAEGQAFGKVPPKRLVALVRGQGWDLLRLRYFNKPWTLPLTPSQVPTTSFNNTFLNRELTTFLGNAQLDILSIEPESVELALEERLVKKIPILLKDSLNFTEEYDLKDSISLQPDSVEIAGPTSLVETLQSWSTKCLKLNDLQSTTTVDIALASTKDRLLTLSEQKVKATVPVEQITEKKFFTPIQIRNAIDSIKIFPNNIQLVVNVGLSKYDSIQAADFELQVDMKDIDFQSENNNLLIEVVKTSPYAKQIYFKPESIEYFILKQDTLAPQEE